MSGAVNRSGAGRGRSEKTLVLVDAAIRLLEEIQPTSVRSVCYQLFTRGFIDSMSKTNTNAVSTHLVWARERGLVPWGWIVDETREAERPGTWDNPDQIIARAVETYRRNHWQDQPQWVEVWSEKGTVRGVLAPVLKKYGVTFRAMRGYSSATSLHDVADETRTRDKVLSVLYVGDWDPSGLHMSEVDLPARLARYGAEARLARIALTAQDVGPGTELPFFDSATKTGDPRHRWFTERYGLCCWELDAMSPVVLRDRVERWIRGHLDLDAWEHAARIEEVEVESMRSFLSDWNSKSGLALKYPQERQ